MSLTGKNVVEFTQQPNIHIWIETDGVHTTEETQLHLLIKFLAMTLTQSREVMNTSSKLSAGAYCTDKKIFKNLNLNFLKTKI